MEVAEKTYCELNFFEDILTHKKDEGAYQLLSKLLKKQCDIYLDIDKETFEKKKEENPIYKKLRKRENLTFKPFPSWQSSITFEETTDQIFLFDSKNRKECVQLRDCYGCLAISNDKQDLDFFYRLNRIHPFILVPESNRTNDKNIVYWNSWKEFFDSFKLPPINSILITDNFLFGEKFKDRKSNSLYAILKGMTSNKLVSDLHITIFFNNSPDKRNGRLPLTEDEAKKVIKEIRDLNLCKNIKITIVAHTMSSTTHDRKIITNYDFIESGVGFSVIDNDGIKQVAQGQEESVVCGLESPITSRMLQVQQILWLKQIFDGDKGMDATYAYIVGDKINRLFF